MNAGGVIHRRFDSRLIGPLGLVVALGATLLVGSPAAAQDVQPQLFFEEHTLYLDTADGQRYWCQAVDPGTQRLRLVHCPPPSEVTTVTVPAYEPPKPGVAAAAWERHVDNAVARYMKIINTAKYESLKQLRQTLKRQVRWTRQELVWLRKHEPESCYRDAWRGWSAAVSDLTNAHEMQQFGIKFGAFLPTYGPSLMPNVESPKEIYDRGVRENVQAWDELLVSAQSPRGSCLP